MSIKSAELQSSSTFRRFCSLAKIEPTRRQWLKWQRAEGAAYQLAAREAGHNRKVRAALAEECAPVTYRHGATIYRGR